MGIWVWGSEFRISGSVFRVQCFKDMDLRLCVRAHSRSHLKVAGGLGHLLAVKKQVSVGPETLGPLALVPLRM